MVSNDERPERDQTDESLAVERAKSDIALREKEAATEQRADVVIERARDEADEVLTIARARADEKLAQPRSAEEVQAAVAQERVREDQVLRDERAQADENLRRERAASLARLFPLERDQTDLYLLTERARSDDVLANRDDFLGMVSHDLRDLLNVIVVSASLIIDDTSKDAQASALLAGAQRIQRSAGRMTRLIADLVDIASIDAGKLAIVPVTTDAAGLVLEAIEIWGPPAASKGIVLEAVAHRPISVKVDNERILQVLGNLITNAVKFSPRGETVVLGVEEAEGDVRFSVKDAGVGIPEDKLEAVFEKFWQVAGNDRRGLGLGLYISRCVVQAHGGKIWARSELAAGSTFFFTVPRGDRGD